MTLPLNLVLVRHGESEGNVAFNRSRKENDSSDFTADFRARHSSLWRLTDKGIEQAKAAGVWLRQEGLAIFDRYITSEYLRAAETAAYLDLPNARWTLTAALRERDVGAFETLSEEERRTQFPEYFTQEKLSHYHWPTPGGESIAHLVTRLKSDVLPLLERPEPEQAVIIVSHGKTIRALGTILEEQTTEVYDAHEESNDTKYRTYNGQIIQYTRVNPTNPNDVRAKFGWVRSICPWNTTRSSNEWRTIDCALTYSNETLLKWVRKTNRLIAH